MNLMRSWTAFRSPATSRNTAATCWNGWRPGTLRKFARGNYRRPQALPPNIRNLRRSWQSCCPSPRRLSNGKPKRKPNAFAKTGRRSFRFGSLGTAKSSAKSAGAGWAWCSRPAKVRGNAGSPSKCCPGGSAKPCPNGKSAFSKKPKPSPNFGTGTSCRFTPSASMTGIAIT